MIEAFAQRSGNWFTLLDSFKRAAESLADDPAFAPVAADHDRKCK